jgi:hypothetical protein
MSAQWPGRPWQRADARTDREPPLLGVCLLLACATEADRLDPHNPGDHCLDSCPEGMACTGITYS